MTSFELVDVTERFSRFLKIKRELANLGTWRDFARASSVAEATVYRILSDGPRKPTTHLNSRNRFAAALGYPNWPMMLADFDQQPRRAVGSEDDGMVEIALPAQLVSRMRAAAKGRGVSLEKWIEQQLSGDHQ